MQPKVLVAYATRTGATEEVASTLAEVLRGRGLSVDVMPAKRVANIEPYGAVVIAVALYFGKMHKDVRQFLTENRASLARIPVAFFVLGPVHQEEKEWKGAQEQLEKDLKNFPWLSPVAQHIVGGRFDAARLGFPFNLIPFFRKIPRCDSINWELIREEAGGLAGQLSRADSWRAVPGPEAAPGTP